MSKPYWLLAALSACHPQGATDLPAPATPPPLSLELSPTYADAHARLVVRGAQPGEAVRLYVTGRGAGAGPCAPDGVTCLGLLSPTLVAVATADDQGEAAARVQTRDRAGRRMWYQAIGTSLPYTLSAVVDAVLLPADEDADQDGLADARELRLGTTIGVADSDADGLLDGAEVDLHGTDPLAPDSDADGLLDGEEITLGADPLDEDSDRDHLPDGREAAFGCSPVDRDADGDRIPDGLDHEPLTPGLRDPGPRADRIAMDPTVVIVDPEFDAQSQRAVMRGEGGDIWLADVTATGELDPFDGRGERIATDAETGAVGYNGPEWVYSARGAGVLYTAYDGVDVGIGYADAHTGRWRARVLPNSYGKVLPFGTTVASDPEPWVRWHVTDIQVPEWGWRRLDDPNSDVLSPIHLRLARWAPGTHTLVGAATHVEPHELYTLDVDTGVFSQISFDGTWKQYSTSGTAPDLGVDVIVATEGSSPMDASRVAIYANAGGGWSRLTELLPPPGYPQVTAVRTMTYGNRGYVVYTASRAFSGGLIQTPGSLWIESVDPADPFRRMIAANTPGDGRLLRDPEPYTGGGAPLVYYTLKGNGPDEIHVAHTGL